MLSTPEDRKNALVTARVAAMITDIARNTTERIVYAERMCMTVGFALMCPKFVDVGRRHGAPPYNEGEEYRGCECGMPLGLHRTEVIEASGIRY